MQGGLGGVSESSFFTYLASGGNTHGRTGKTEGRKMWRREWRKVVKKGKPGMGSRVGEANRRSKEVTFGGMLGIGDVGDGGGDVTVESNLLR